MKPTPTLLIGAPLSGDEARFLRQLHADLKGVDALILANFETPRRQIDLVVVTPTYAALLELKNFPRPIFGQQNGVWMYENSGGQRLRYGGENPWQQALAEKFALSDEMLRFQRANKDIPYAGSRGFFTQFDAFVCIFPEIHRDSEVTGGDHKVTVSSYREVLDSLRTKSISSSWNLQVWQRFAEQHLNLSPTTLAEATSPAINEASEKVRAYRDRLAAVVGTALPPLSSLKGEITCGQKLLDQLLEPKNFILVGPSGSAKTFHLHHLLLTMAAKGDELPLLIEAKRYRGGDFWTVLRHGTAPLFRGDPRELLDAARLCALKPVLMVDALNECGEDFKGDLLRGIQSFVVQFGGRVIFSSQVGVELPADIAAHRIALSLPNEVQKREIYAYHAGVDAATDLDKFCGGFTNAYDLTIAGRCHSAAANLTSKADLYDRYIRRCLPENTTIATALLRRVASEMSARFSFALNRDEFETIAEQFLSEQKAPLSVVDQLGTSRLVQLNDEGFTFEHEQLLDYFEAEGLRRRINDVAELAAELSKPRHQHLIELILPKYSAAGDLRVLLSAADDARLLSRVLQGSCGPLAQKELLAECEMLLEEAARDLPNVQLQCQSIDLEGGRRGLGGVEVEGHRQWSTFSALLCHTIALNISDSSLQAKVLDLLDLTEWTLRGEALKAAKAVRFKPGPVWGEMVRLYGGGIQHGSVKLPCCTILSSLRMIQMFPRHYKKGLPIYDQLLERVGRTPEGHFSMLTLLEDLNHGDSTLDLRTQLGLAKQACNSGIYILQIDGLRLLQYLSHDVHETAREELSGIRSLLDSFDGNNIMLNTAVVDALTAYDFLEPPVSLEDALAEFQAVIAAKEPFDPALSGLASLSETSPEQFLCERAYGLLGNIFEDVFQNVYFAAYSSLSLAEKSVVLCRGANAGRSGFHTDWILQELLKYGEREALTIFKRFASVPDGGSFSPQEAVAVFTLGIEGCARLEVMPPASNEQDSADIRAWRAVGEILFLRAQNRPVPDDIWERFTGTVGLAAADVFYQLEHAQMRLPENQRSHDLVTHFSEPIRPILEECLRHRDSLSSIFKYGGSRDRSVTQFLIRTLGAIGRSESISVLTDLADNHTFGRDAVASLESIKKRHFPPGLSAAK